MTLFKLKKNQKLKIDVNAVLLKLLHCVIFINKVESINGFEKLGVHSLLNSRQLIMSFVKWIRWTRYILKSRVTSDTIMY